MGKGWAQGVPHCSVLTICFLSAVSALTCQLFLRRSSSPTTWQYPSVGPAPWREGGRAGGQGWVAGTRVAAPGKAWAGRGLCTDPPLTRSPMASPSWRLATVRPTSSAPWWPSRTHTRPAWPSGPCSVGAALAAGGGGGGGGAGRAERGLSSRRRRAGDHRGGGRHRHPAPLHGCLQALPQGHRLLHGGRVPDLHRPLPRPGHAGMGPG